MDATDGRPYVALGKILVGQRRFDEARKLYEDGSMATDGGNAHIWQVGFSCWEVSQVADFSLSMWAKLLQSSVR